jgi:hypothetical protein
MTIENDATNLTEMIAIQGVMSDQDHLLGVGFRGAQAKVTWDSRQLHRTKRRRTTTSHLRITVMRGI